MENLGILPTILNIAVFLLVLSVLIVVHEWGHFITARKLGVKVEKFSIGFGKKLCSWTSKGTEFMISAVPLGGYVKMAGDERHNCTGAKEEFFSHPVGHRSLIVFMGPAINFIFAYVCFYFIFVVGFPTLGPVVGKVMDDFPAAEVGIQSGDWITHINEKEIKSWDDLQSMISRSEGDSLSIRYTRGQNVFKKQIVPQEKTITNIFQQEENVYVIGVQSPVAEEIEDNYLVTLRYGWLESFREAGVRLVELVVLTFRSLYFVVTGAIPAKDALAGPVRIFDIITKASHQGFMFLTYITAVISANLAIINLLPVPVLDGGYLVMFMFEKVFRRPVPEKVEEGLLRFGLTLLIMLMIFMVYNDIVAVGWLESLRNLFSSK